VFVLFLFEIALEKKKNYTKEEKIIKDEKKIV